MKNQKDNKPPFKPRLISQAPAPIEPIRSGSSFSYKPKTKPDYDYWKKQAYWRLYECAALICGYEPKRNIEFKINEVKKTYELIKRSYETGELKGYKLRPDSHERVQISDFIKWSLDKKLSIPEELSDLACQSELLTEKVFPCKPDTKWEDVKITLTADDKVRIETPQSKGHFTYHELKMNDKRSGDKPTVLWSLLTIFAKKKGHITGKTDQYYENLPDNTKRLNRQLKDLFGIDDSIFKYHYRKHKAYITKIKFDDQTYSPESTCSDDSLKKTLHESEVEDIENKLNLPVYAKYDRKSKLIS